MDRRHTQNEMPNNTNGGTKETEKRRRKRGTEQRKKKQLLALTAAGFWGSLLGWRAHHEGTAKVCDNGLFTLSHHHPTTATTTTAAATTATHRPTTTTAAAATATTSDRSWCTTFQAKSVGRGFRSVGRKGVAHPGSGGAVVWGHGVLEEVVAVVAGNQARRVRLAMQ
jgi:hypothetical protein